MEIKIYQYIQGEYQNNVLGIAINLVTSKVLQIVIHEMVNKICKLNQ